MAKPTVTITATDDITPTTATANGAISDTGAERVSKRGFVISTTSHADPGNVVPQASGYEDFGEEIGNFVLQPFDWGFTALLKNTLYYVRAYAKNPSGYSYSAETSFTTLTQYYPTAIYPPRTKLNKIGADYRPQDPYTFFAPDITKLDDEVVKIETELGTSPKGAFADVKAAISDKLSKSVKDEFYALGYVSSPSVSDDICIEQGSAQYAKKGTSLSAVRTLFKTYFDTIYNNLGYTLQGETIIPAPADEDSLYYDTYWGSKSTSSGKCRFRIPKTGHIKYIVLETFYTGTAPSGEYSTHYLVKNGDFDNETLIYNNTVKFNVQAAAFTNSALNIAVTAGDYIELHFDAPVWVTNPGGLVLKTTIYVDV